MKVITIICSTPRRGNCLDIAERTLELIDKKDIETKMIKPINHARI